MARTSCCYATQPPKASGLPGELEEFIARISASADLLFAVAIPNIGGISKKVRLLFDLKTPKGVSTNPGKMPDIVPHAARSANEGLNAVDNTRKLLDDAPRSGFGVTGLLSKIEKGVPDKTIQEFYQAAASSPLFRKKLGLANLLSGGKKVSVDDILLQLQKSSKFRRIESLGNARIDVLKNGMFVFRHSADTGVFSRAAAHHELLHLAQFIRNPSLKTSARNLSFLQRQAFEPIPALIGSPEIFGVPTLIVTGTGVYVVYESSGLIFELLDE